MKRILYIFIFLGLGLSGFAQGRQLKNNPRYDRKPLHFGFSLGLNYIDLRTRYVPNLGEAVPGYYSMTTETSPGYSIRIISNLRLGHYFDLRFSPGFAATERRLFFDVNSPFTGDRVEVERRVESSFLEFPLYLKWKSARVGNYRLYLMAGPKYALDLASDEDVLDDRIFKLQADEFSYDLAFGVDMYFEYFKFSPQIIASFGMNNMLVQDDTFLVEGLQAINTRAILINFTFE